MPKRLNVNRKKTPRSFEEIKKLELALELVLAELSPEERTHLEEVIRAQGVQVMLEYMNKRSDTDID